MSSGEFSAKNSPSPERITSAKIYQQLCDLAFINAAFKQGLIEGISWTVETSEVGVPIPEMAHTDWPEPNVATSYSFEAKRYPLEDGNVSYDFTYSRSRAKYNILMPAHIAAYAYSSKDDPVAAAGPSARVHSIQINIDSDDQEIDLSEGVEFYDHEDDQVGRIHTGTRNEHEPPQTIVPQMPAEDYYADQLEGEPLTLNSLIDDIPMQFTLDAAERYQTLDKPDSLESMADLISDYDVEYQNIILAAQVLEGLKQALRDNYGMHIAFEKLA